MPLGFGGRRRGCRRSQAWPQTPCADRQNGQDGHDRGANVVASRSTTWASKRISGPLFQTPEETLALALERDVDVVGASSTRGGS